MLLNYAADDFGALGDNCVSKASIAVQSIGKPMSHSTKFGCNGPVGWTICHALHPGHFAIDGLSWFAVSVGVAKRPARAIDSNESLTTPVRPFAPPQLLP